MVPVTTEQGEFASETVGIPPRRKNRISTFQRLGLRDAKACSEMQSFRAFDCASVGTATDVRTHADWPVNVVEASFKIRNVRASVARTHRRFIHFPRIDRHGRALSHLASDQITRNSPTPKSMTDPSILPRHLYRRGA